MHCAQGMWAGTRPSAIWPLPSAAPWGHTEDKGGVKIADDPSLLVSGGGGLEAGPAAEHVHPTHLPALQRPG